MSTNNVIIAKYKPTMKILMIDVKRCSIVIVCSINIKINYKKSSILLLIFIFIYIGL